MVCLSGMVQLAVALGTVTLVAVTGFEGILGLGPAIFLIAGALAVGPAGRISDRVGRMPVIRDGLRLRHGRAGDHRARLLVELRRAGRPRARVLRRGAGDRDALACRRRRDVPARAARPRDVVRALRRRRGRRLRPADLRPAVRRPRSDARATRVAVARLVAVRAGRLPRHAARAARSEGALEGVRDVARAERAAGASPRDPAPARRADGDARGRRELRGDGRRDEPRRLRRRRPRPRARRRVHDHQRAHRRDVRARPRRRRPDRPHRP